MLLILEIMLTIHAWKKGWKGFALLPMGILLGLGFMLGASLETSGGSIDDY